MWKLHMLLFGFNVYSICPPEGITREEEHVYMYVDLHILIYNK